MTKRIHVIESKLVYKSPIFNVEEAKFQQELADGKMSPEITRINLERGESVAALIHNTAKDTLIFVEQFRYPTHKKGPGWTLELPAGIIDGGANETPEKTMRRELIEEIGYQVADLKLIHSFYPSPGGSSERIHLFYAAVKASHQISDGGGDHSVGEYTRRIELQAEEALKHADMGRIIDAKTIIALQWLKIQRLTKKMKS
jgi:ADP-ribose pyrophosphatase